MKTTAESVKMESASNLVQNAQKVQKLLCVRLWLTSSSDHFVNRLSSQILVTQRWPEILRNGYYCDSVTQYQRN